MDDNAERLVGEITNLWETDLNLGHGWKKLLEIKAKKKKTLKFLEFWNPCSSKFAYLHFIII